ncbi:hypothetical protein BJP42_10835 (plasmid) [Candidatus Williamhamiltonella defendens]|nr:hypothetical protein BJP42_10835 [Candidatus Hamiltonella defensa]
MHMLICHIDNVTYYLKNRDTVLGNHDASAIFVSNGRGKGYLGLFIVLGLILSLLLVIVRWSIMRLFIFDLVHLRLFYLKKRQIKILLISTN